MPVTPHTIMPMKFHFARNGEIRRFLTSFLIVSLGVLAIGLAGGFVLLRRVEAGLLANQAEAADGDPGACFRLELPAIETPSPATLGKQLIPA